MKQYKFAAIGDTIQTTFSDGRIVSFLVKTPEQSAEANELIMSGRWKRKETIQIMVNKSSLKIIENNA